MNYQVFLTAHAENDLNAIYSYISDTLFSPEAAAHTCTAIEEAVLSLGQYPERYGCLPFEPERSAEIRTLPVRNYVVFYQIRDKAVFILRILYSRSDLISRFRKGI